MGMNMQHYFVHRAGKLSFFVFDVVAAAFQMPGLAQVVTVQLLSDLRFGREKKQNRQLCSIQ